MTRLALLLAFAAPAAPVPKGALPPLGPANANALVKKHKGRLAVEASTECGGWPTAKAFDGDEATSWFSAAGETASAGLTPWVKATFPEDVLVRRVTIRGNREPQWPNGYSALEGRVELLDAAGKVLVARELKAAGDRHDFEFVPANGVGAVRAVKFTVTRDQGTGGHTAVGEFQVE
jgi:hypothetical protein